MSWASASAGVIRRGIDRAYPPLIVLLAILAAWHWGTALADVPTIIFPSPRDVALALIASVDLLLADAAVTAVTAGLGLLAGGVLGLLIAFGMVYSPTFSALAYPYVLALRIVPLIAVAPLVFLWFGRQIPARALLVTSLTIFPVTIASLDGLRSVPREYVDIARSVGASEGRIFLSIRVPAAAPSVVAGFKLAGALSVIGAIVAEFITLESGLGYRIFYAATGLRTARMFAALVVLAVVGIGFYTIPAVLAARLSWDQRR